MKKLLWALAMWFALSGVAMAVVNINTATKEELTSLKGVGDKRAQEILEQRYVERARPDSVAESLEHEVGVDRCVPGLTCPAGLKSRRDIGPLACRAHQPRMPVVEQGVSLG